MKRPRKTPLRLAAATLAIVFAAQAAPAFAEHEKPGEHHAEGARIERQREPMGYHRIERPSGVEIRPQQIDRQAYAHEFQADHAFRIGPYHADPSWRYTRWQHGQFLPSSFWTERFWLTDYWLFGLDVPPVGYEWVRYGNDTLLVNVTNGEIVQVVYGLFR